MLYDIFYSLGFVTPAQYIKLLKFINICLRASAITIGHIIDKNIRSLSIDNYISIIIALIIASMFMHILCLILS